MSWYDDWCAYCRTKHGSAEALRTHVAQTHPDSIRERHYLREATHMAKTPETIQVEYDVEVRIKTRDGKVISTATHRLGTDIRVGAYTPAERVAREAVAQARKELGYYGDE